MRSLRYRERQKSTPYYVYQVHHEAPAGGQPASAQGLEFEPLQVELTQYGASLAVYWPERAGQQSYLAVAAPSFDSGISQALDSYADGLVTFVAEGQDVEAALPNQLDVCSYCGASPPRHLASCPCSLATGFDTSL